MQLTTINNSIIFVLKTGLDEVEPVLLNKISDRYLFDQIFKCKPEISGTKICYRQATDL